MIAFRLAFLDVNHIIDITSASYHDRIEITVVAGRT
jgi:hypothetical protein